MELFVSKSNTSISKSTPIELSDQVPEECINKIHPNGLIKNLDNDRIIRKIILNQSGLNEQRKLSTKDCSYKVKPKIKGIQNQSELNEQRNLSSKDRSYKVKRMIKEEKGVIDSKLICDKSVSINREHISNNKRDHRTLKKSSIMYKIASKSLSDLKFDTRLFNISQDVYNKTLLVSRIPKGGRYRFNRRNILHKDDSKTTDCSKDLQILNGCQTNKEKGVIR